MRDVSDNKPHYDVLIATPGRSFEAEYVKSLVPTLQYLHENNISYRFVSQYSSTVSGAREATLMDDHFLDIFNDDILLGKATADKVFWIDSDMSWSVEDFKKIYESDKDIISGVYISDQGVPMFSINGTTVKSKELAKTKDVVEVGEVGFGFVCMKSEIFSKIDRPWFSTVHRKIEQDGQERLIPYGEDYSLCIRAKQAGYKIFVDTSVRLGHHKKQALYFKD
jgi:GT2 family glycosyltransferase